MGAEETAPKPLEGMSVLVLEDYALVFRTLRRILTSAGCKDVCGAASAAEGLQLLDGLEPDVMLVDINLGEGKPTGIDFLTQARARGCDSVAIIYTRDASKEQHFRAALAGADYYLIKDGELSVVEEIDRAVARHSSGVNGERSSRPDLDEGLMRSTRVTLTEKQVLESWVERGCPPLKLFAHAIGKRYDWVRHVFTGLYQKLKLDGLSELAHLATSCAMMNTPSRGVRKARRGVDA